MKLNATLALISSSLITSPPVATAVPAFATFSAVVENTVEACDLTFTAAIEATEKVILSATAGQSAGKSFIKSEYRVIDILTNADTSVHDALAAYKAKFGEIPATGQKVFFKMQQVNIATGIAGATIYCNTVVATGS
jgi:hypothetical protein